MATAGNWIVLLVFLALVAAAAALGVVFKPGAWYTGLAKPAWTPPDWLFGPVWTVLYVMIAVSGWLVWNRAASSPAMALWFAQLLFNALWSWIFFGMHRMGLGFLDIAMMWICIFAFVILAWPVSKAAAAMFVPYWLWVSYAGALNFALWRLNG